MASKVNTKFVAILGAGLAVAAVGVAFVGVRVLNKPASFNVTEGEKLLAAGDVEKAVAEFGKAVKKEPNNVEFLTRWVAAMERQTPAGFDKYVDVFNREYIAALRRLAETKRDDVAAHRRLLDPMVLLATLGGGDLGSWDRIASQTEDALRLFPEGGKGRDIIGRFRGIARLEQMQLRANVTDRERSAIGEDLRRAIAADPTDETATLALVRWTTDMAGRMRADRNDAEAAALVEQTRGIVQNVINAAEPGPIARLALSRLEITEAFVAAAPQRTRLIAEFNALGNSPRAAEIRKQLEDLAQKLSTTAANNVNQALTALGKLDPAAVKPLDVLQVVSDGVQFIGRDALAQGIAVLTAAHQKRPADVLVLYALARLEEQNGNLQATSDWHGKIVALKDLPLSYDGLMLFSLRDSSLMARATLALAMAEQSRSAGKSDDARKDVDSAKAFRDEFAKRVGNRTDLANQLLKFDGQLAVFQRDFLTARRLLADHSEKVGRNDPQTLRLLSGVLMEMGDFGAARDQLVRLREITRNSPNVAVRNDPQPLITLADIESRLGNQEAALRLAEEAVQSADALGASELAGRARAIAADLKQLTSPDDAVFRALSEARKFVDARLPDPEKARAELKKVVDAPLISALAGIQLSTALRGFGDTADADKVLARTREKFPNDPRILALDRQKAAPATVEAAIAEVDADARRSPLDRALAKMVIHAQTGNAEEADKQLEIAKGIDANHPLVVGRLFEDALAAKNWAEAERLAKIAGDANHDRNNGLLYRARLAAAQNRLEEAASLAQQVTELDTLNAAAWRVLGALRVRSGKVAEGVTALQRSIQIKPDDPETIIELTRAHLTARRPEDALRVARAGRDFALSAPGFIDMYLALESEFGDRTAALERRRRIFFETPFNQENTLQYLRILAQTAQWQDFNTAIQEMRASIAKARTRTDLPADRVEAFKQELDSLELGVLPLEAVYFAGTRRSDEARQVFDRMIAAVPADKREGSEHIAFADVVATFGNDQLALDVLMAGREFQKPDTMAVDRVLGDFHFNRGRWDEAAQAYRRALDSVGNEKGGVLLLRIADCLTRTNKPQEAVDLLAPIKPADDVAAVSISLLRAEAYAGLGDAAKVSENLAAAERISPRMPQIPFLRADLALRQLNLTDRSKITDAQRETLLAAQRSLEQAVALDPTMVPARRRLAETLFNLSEDELALASLREGLSLNPGDFKLRESLVASLAQLGRGDEALAVIEEGSQRTNNLEWTRLAAEEYGARGNFAKASELFSKVWEQIRSPQVASRYVLSLLSRTPPEVATARQVLAEPKLEVDKNVELLLLRARCGVAEGKSAEWNRDARAALALINPDDARQVNQFFMGLLVNVFTRPGESQPRMADAAAFVARLEPAGGFNEIFQFNLAMLRRSDPDQRDRVTPIFRTLAKSAKDKEIAYGAARIAAQEAFQRNEPAEAELFMNTAITVGSELLVARTNPSERAALTSEVAQVRIELAWLYVQQNKFQEALSLTTEVAKAAPGSLRLAEVQGLAHAGLSQWDQAGEVLRTARDRTGPSNLDKVGLTIALARVELGRGNRDQARSLAREARQILDGEAPPRPKGQAYGSDLQKLETTLSSGG
ncbi:MAG: tetratricopeptide repeat protein [Planctomycetaceae bacterium]|jgi:tetratricopeptide (TPR) repeat protein|nr:tetratricopeptide repeat protein [Planctomycetaceae bacterium]